MDRERIQSAIELAESILDELELGQAPLARTSLKCLRLARIIGDEKLRKMFSYELAGYPSDEHDIEPYDKEVAEIASMAGRRTWDEINQVPDFESISIGDAEIVSLQAEEALASLDKQELEAIKAVSRATQYQVPRLTAALNAIRQEKTQQNWRVRNAKSLVTRMTVNFHTHITSEYLKLKFEGFVSDVLEKRRKNVDKKLADQMPEISRKFVSASENLRSSNPEDWALAATTCRRILKDIADRLYPASEKEVAIDGKTVKLTDDRYINRLMQFIVSKSSSKRFEEIVGSHLGYIGDRVDAINNSGSKGTHDEVTQEEAERIVAYTYSLAHDILSLLD